MDVSAARCSGRVQVQLGWLVGFLGYSLPSSRRPARSLWVQPRSVRSVPITGLGAGGGEGGVEGIEI